MKYKLLIVLITLFLLLNNVSGVTYDDEFYHTGSGDNSYSTPAAAPATVGYYYVNSVLFNDISTMSNLAYMQYRITDGWFYNPGGLEYDYCDVTLKIGSDTVGTGVYGFYQDAGYTYFQLWVYNLDVSSYSGSQIVILSGNDISITTTYTAKFVYTNSVLSGNDKVNFRTSNGKYPYDNSRLYTTYYTYEQIFPFNYTNIDDVYSMKMERDAVLTSKITVTILDSEIINETSLQTEDFMYVNTSSPIWIVTNENIFGDINTKNLFFEGVSTTPNLYTDKSLYNASEIIAVTWENINYYYDNQIKWGTRKPFEMHIVYYDYDSLRYEAKYQEWLTYNLEDETLYLDSSLFTPQQNYKVIITSSDGDFHRSDTWLISYDFSVIPDDEYLSLSCNAPNCYTYTNSEIDIYYKINNNSVLRIYDNDNNLIHAWYNIIGSGYKSYTIPPDINQVNTYPNWNVYLNNTGYSTSFNAPFTVYYSTMVIPTPTPTPIIDEAINESVEDMISELKDESKPIFDLIYGLSTIVVDNPDYDDSGIIDEYEINNWFNNLVPLLIVFFLFVMYLGLKKENRGDKP